ncbi:protein of unknown function [Cupriavidus neocaledonicus]|uniref:Uncharacterized protein n=1 Tax=Cupriavidus neocaledonicus TaxID=1040979 RepID=A0A375H5X3_9BURK|nr:protein of unknown function [Cupriavidus neocaledonicus]
MVGLPHAGIPAQCRSAHRPYPAVAGADRAVHRLRDRPGAAHMGAAVRSHAGGGDAALRLSRAAVRARRPRWRKAPVQASPGKPRSACAAVPATLRA